MKRLVSILLLVFAVATGFAQSSTPDYIQKAKVGLTQYYPQFKDYFEPIFTRTFKLSTSSQNIINTKIHDNFDLFDEELPTEKDRVTTILLVLEKVISGQVQLSKSIETTTKGKDLIEIADEISNDANQQARAESEQAQAEIDQIKRRNNKLDEIKEVINSNGISQETIGKIADKIEEYFTLFEIEETQNNIGLQTILKQYINLTKQINRRPNALGQKFIDEYNRITKTK
jgi:hypothetical protein